MIQLKNCWVGVKQQSITLFFHFFSSNASLFQSYCSWSFYGTLFCSVWF